MRNPDAHIRKGAAAMLFATALLLGGCFGNGPSDLLATAELEEVQDNPEHAREIYAEIVRRYPESAEASKARERLAALAGAKDKTPQGPSAGSMTQ
jgi:hypothetical protein